MRSRALKRQQQMRAFRKLIAAFLEENPDCQFPLGCDAPSEVIHHSRGRFGQRLLNREYWRASCNDHNQFAEEKTGEALDCGWLVPIEAVDA